MFLCSARVFLANSASQVRRTLTAMAPKNLFDKTDELITRSYNKRDVRIVVIGDPGTGKSSMIYAAANSTFPKHVDPVLPPTTLPGGFCSKGGDFLRESTSVKIFDTSSCFENRKLLKEAEVVVLTYACDKPETFDRLQTYWFPELHRLHVNVRSIVVGCKRDASNDDRDTVELIAQLERFRIPFKIENFIQASARYPSEAKEVFYHALNALLYPSSLLYDREEINDEKTLTTHCRIGLDMIFQYCDRDEDCHFSPEEWDTFQVKCFGTSLQASAMADIEKIKRYGKRYYDDMGLTETGYHYLLKRYITNGSPEKVWKVLMTYRNDCSSGILQAPDQSVELSCEAIKFLEDIFNKLNHEDGVISPSQFAQLFKSGLESSHYLVQYMDAVERTEAGFSFDAYMSVWTLMMLLEPNLAKYNILVLHDNLDYDGTLDSLFHITRERTFDRKKQQSGRNVFQCFVFGPENCGKSMLLDKFIKRQSYKNGAFSENFAVNAVGAAESKKTLVLREIPEDGMEDLLSESDSWASCDVAIFVYDSSKKASLRRAADMLQLVSRHGGKSGFEVPCLLVGVEKGLYQDAAVVQDSNWVSLFMGIETPIHVKESDPSAVYSKIINAAERPHENIPHENIPNTKAGRNVKQYNLIFVSVGAVVAVGLNLLNLVNSLT